MIRLTEFNYSSPLRTILAKIKKFYWGEMKKKRFIFDVQDSVLVEEWTLA